MTTKIANGDEVEITIKATVDGETEVYDGCRRVEDTNGRLHYVYVPSADMGAGGCKITVVKPAKPAESFEWGEAYKDADGDTFIRTTSNEWIDTYGTRRRDSYPSRPLRHLTVPTITEGQVKAAIESYIRTKGVYGKISTVSAGALAKHLVQRGVKVAE